MLTYPWKCTVLHCNHLGNTWKPLVVMTRHFDYCPSASEGDNQSVSSSAPVVSRCFPGGYNVKLYISRGRLAWLLLAFLHSVKPRIVVLFCWYTKHCKETALRICRICWSPTSVTEMEWGQQMTSLLSMSPLLNTKLAFCVFSPKMWNMLPKDVRLSTSVTYFIQNCP